MCNLCQLPSLKLTIIALKKLPKPNRKVFFQPSFFGGELLNFQGVHFDFLDLDKVKSYTVDKWDEHPTKEKMGRFFFQEGKTSEMLLST